VEIIMALWRIEVGGGAARLAAGPVDKGPQVLLPDGQRISDLLAGGGAAFAAAAARTDGERVPAGAQVLAPIDDQEVWAAGVTYERSRAARMEESKIPDQYDRVYDAERPEVFFKALGWRVRGPGEKIGIRADSTWDVPEPELGLVIAEDGQVVGYTIGNDVSSRSIEGENALYLPQAKSFIGSCALGPCLVPVKEAPDFRDLTITIDITRDKKTIYGDSVSVTRMKRSPEELADWLTRAQDFPQGVILLTGTALVPPNEITMEAGDVVTIRINGLGELKNPAVRVGRAAKSQK
jgi:2-dehydro-3-deoxy-D-arabinonate dehydratase